MTVELRAAGLEDCKLYWGWVNDPAVRKNSFSPDPVSWQAHQDWFEKALNTRKSEFFVVEKDGEPVGQLRLDYHSHDCPEINIGIAAPFRGQGLGVQALLLAKQLLLRKASVLRIVARIRAENSSSIATFRKAGYVEEGSEKVKGFEAVRMSCKLEGK